MLNQNKADLLVGIVSFGFGISLLIITIIAGFYMQNYTFGAIGLLISILCFIIGIIKVGKLRKKL